MRSTKPVESFEQEESDRSTVQLVLGAVDRIPVARVRWLVELAERMEAPEKVHAHLRAVLADDAYGQPGDGALSSQVDRELESRFWRNVLKERALIELASKGPRAATRGAGGTLELVTSTAGTARDALATLGALADIAYGVPVFSVAQRNDGSVAVLYESPEAEQDAVARLAAEVALSSVIELVRRGVGNAGVVASAIQLRGSATAGTTALARAAGCEVRLGATTDRVDLPADVAALPFVTRDEGLHQAARRLARLEREALFCDHVIPNVRWALRELVSKRGRNEDDELLSVATAAILRMRPRTMQSRLTAEGTSFRTMVDEARRVAVDRMLAEGHGPTDIQTALGYGDTASLRRACRRWWGMGPTARQRALG